MLACKCVVQHLVQVGKKKNYHNTDNRIDVNWLMHIIIRCDVIQCDVMWWCKNVLKQVRILTLKRVNLKNFVFFFENFTSCLVWEAKSRIQIFLLRKTFTWKRQIFTNPVTEMSMVYLPKIIFWGIWSWQIVNFE